MLVSESMAQYLRKNLYFMLNLKLVILFLQEYLARKKVNYFFYHCFMFRGNIATVGNSLYFACIKIILYKVK